MNTNQLTTAKRKNISPKSLNEFFEELAASLNAEEIELYKECEADLFKEKPEEARAGLADYVKNLKIWKMKIRAGGLLRILQHLGAYDGKRIDCKRLETALLTFNFVLSCANDLNGLMFWFDRYETEITLNDVRRALRYVRNA